MTQTYTSAATSINAAKLPRIYNAITIKPNDIIFDYGCGKYTDHIREALPESTEYLAYDPFNQPYDVNTASINTLHAETEEGKPVTFICSNVLNVIDSDETISNIIRALEKTAARTPGSRILVTVYEGDRTGKGRETMKDCYQRNETTRAYLRFFSGNATIKRGVITETF